MRALGVDLGTKRIGLAVATHGVATPLEVIDRGSDDENAAARIAEIATEQGAGMIVVGLPTRMQGNAGQAAEAAERFAKLLRERGCEVALWDERLTTAEVERTLIAAGTRRRSRRTVVDKLAATVMLQSYLDARSARERQP